MIFRLHAVPQLLLLFDPKLLLLLIPHFLDMLLYVRLVQTAVNLAIELRLRYLIQLIHQKQSLFQVLPSLFIYLRLRQICVGRSEWVLLKVACRQSKC